MEYIKIVIVDDDLASRNRIKGYLHKSREYEVVADFSTGKAAIEWLRAGEADIVLCDMQMTVMNGVEFIQMLRTVNEYMPVVAISSFDDFNYTRGCMVNGAADYLLKHELDQTLLLRVLDEVKHKYRITPESGNGAVHRIGYCISDPACFTAGHIEELVDTGKISFETNNIVPIVISPDFHILEAPDVEYRQDINLALIDIISQLLGADYKYLICHTAHNQLVVLLSFGDANSLLYIMNATNGFCDKLRRRVAKMLDMSLTFAMGTVCRKLPGAIDQSAQLLALAGEKYYLGPGKVFRFEQSARLGHTEYQLPEALAAQLAFELAQPGGAGAAELLAGVFHTMQSARAPRQDVDKTIQRLLDILAGAGMLDATARAGAESRLAQAETMGQQEEILLQLHHAAALQAREGEEKAYSGPVERVLDFVEYNFAKDISLEDCARHANLSYTHLSREFKRETGQRFSEYLNGLRLQKAKSLMIRGELSMKEIIERVGFRNYNYFFKVFKESEGITPTEFVAKIYSKN